MRLKLAFCLLASLFGANLEAAIIFDEGTSVTQLSKTNTAPTILGTLPIGTSTVIGNVANANNNATATTDIFTFVIAPGTILDTIIVSQYVSTDDLGFIAIDEGPTFPYTYAQLNALSMDPTKFIGGTTFGPANNTVGTFDLLSSLSPGFGSRSVVGYQPIQGTASSLPYDALGPNSYTILVQQNSAPNIHYTLDLGVIAYVPEPSSVMLLTIAAFVSLARRNRHT